MSQDDKSRIEKIMKEPSPLEITEYEERIRRNLLVFSALAILSLFLKISPSDKAQVWGVGFENLTTSSIYIVLSFVIFYELSHYLWIIWNKFSYWRARLTGCKLEESRGDGSGVFGSSAPDLADYNGSERNSTVYNWLLENRDKYHAAMGNIESTQANLNLLVEKVNDEGLKKEEVSRLVDEVIKLKAATGTLVDYLNNERLNESLRRFDNWFDMLIKSQSWRWVILDFITPLLLGMVALCMLLLEIVINNDSNLLSKMPSCMLFNL